MNTQLKSLSSFFAALILSAGTLSTAQAGGPSGALQVRLQQPEILSTEVDGVHHRLWIHGTQFDTHSLVVTLGGRVLPVLKATTTEIIAALPADTRSATTYLLHLSSGDKSAQTAAFNIPVQLAEAETGSRAPGQ